MSTFWLTRCAHEKTSNRSDEKTNSKRSPSPNRAVRARSPFAPARGDARLRCTAPHVAPRPTLQAPLPVWTAGPGLDRAELRPRESPGGRSGKPARRDAVRRPADPASFAQPPPRYTRCVASRARAGLQRGWQYTPRTSPRTTPTRCRPCRRSPPVCCPADRCPPASDGRLAFAEVQALGSPGSSPHGYFRASVPRAARSHSASVGKRNPAQAQNAAASHQLTPTTGRDGIRKLRFPIFRLGELTESARLPPAFVLVAFVFDEMLVLPHGHRIAGDAECVQVDLMDRRFVVIRRPGRSSASSGPSPALPSRTCRRGS